MILNNKKYIYLYMNTINERLDLVLNEHFKGNVSKFARSAGIPQTTLNNIIGERRSKPHAGQLTAT